MEFFLIILCFIVLFLVASFSRQDWSSPAYLNLYWNLFFIFFAVFVFGTNIKWNFSGIWWILLSCFMFLIGQMIGNKIVINFSLRKAKGRKINGNPYFILIIIILLGFLNPLIYIESYGFSLHSIFDFKTLLHINTIIAQDRYSTQQIVVSGITVLLGALSYMGALSGGYMFVCSTLFKERFICICTLFPVIALALITNAKVGVIAIVFLWVIGLQIAYLDEHGKQMHITKILVIRLILIFIISIFLLDFIMMLRIGNVSTETQKIVNIKMQEYAFGQIESFAVWFKRFGDLTYDMGMNTFMFFANFLGLTVRKQGVYGLLDGLTSNIYTQNRGIITDFGIIGGLLYWFLLGVISGIVYRRVKGRFSHCIASKVILGAIYFSILYGFIISPWIYTSYVAAFIGFGIFLKYIRDFKYSIRGS